MDSSRSSPGAGDSERDADETAESDDDSGAELRERVEADYDMEEFGPEEMDQMSLEEWEAAFDADAWITGRELLDRAEADLARRVAERDVFAVVERVERDLVDRDRTDGDPTSNRGVERDSPDAGDSGWDTDERLLAYSDEGYAIVYPDGSVEGRGTVLRDVKPTVALASMPEYEVPDAPEGGGLPDPSTVPEGSGELGNRLMQVIAAVHVVAGLAMLVSWIAFQLSVIAAVAGLGFLAFGGFVFLLVANARLSDRFRAEEYRDRLRAVGADSDDRPEFLPLDEESEE